MMFIAFSLKSIDNQDAICPGKPVLHSVLWGVREVGREVQAEQAE